MVDPHSHEIAARLRALFAKPDDQDWEVVAERLRVSELALRMSIDPLEPHPTIEVITAAIAHYGVDPTWILTGEYDPGTHRRALGDEMPDDTAAVADVLAKLLPEGLASITSARRTA